MPKQPLPEELIIRIARRFKALSEPLRLDLLNQMMIHGEMTVSALIAATGHRQANISKHLNLMTGDGILSRRKEGLHVFYTIADPTIHSICLLVCGQLQDEFTGK